MHYKTLDSLRFFSFFAVFISHHSILDIGHLGVLCFFVLSGFLLIPKLYAFKDSFSPNFFLFFYNFFRRRVLRIFPLYFLFLSVTFLFFDWLSIKTLLYSVFFSNNLLSFLEIKNGNYAIELPHLWSLSVEEQIYIILPFLIWFFYKNYTALLSIIVLMVFLSKFLFYFYFEYNFDNSNLLISAFSYLFSPFYLSSFLIGGFFALNQYKIVPSLFLLILGFIVLMTTGFFSTFLQNGWVYYKSLGYPSSFSMGYQWMWAYFLWSIFFGYMLLLLTKSNNFLSFLLDDKFLAYLGKVSYGLYIFHYPVIVLCYKYFNFGLVFQILLSFAITLFISFASYEFYEKHFLKLK